MEKIYSFLRNEIKLNKQDIIVVGVSAGPDSMALLYILNDIRKEIPYKIVVAHVNHNLREESKEEAIFLEDYCKKNDCIFEQMVIEKYGDDNFHNEARNIRYNFYRKLIEKYNANYLMTGHHGDDLIETIMMRLVRGSTLKGYCGFNKIVDMSNYKIVRPLIYATKEELKDFDEKNNIPYRIDKSNFKDKYTRNRYRKYVLPFLKEEDTNVHDKFLKYSETLYEYEEHLRKETNICLEECYKDGIINIDKFLKYDLLLQKRMIDFLLENIYHDDLIEIDNRHVDLILEALNSKKANLVYNLPNDYVVIKEYNKLYFKKNIDEIISYDIELTNKVYLSNGMTIEKIEESSTDGNDILRINSIDVKLPLRVRSRKNGDRIYIKNMKGSRKVKDIFIDKKIPLRERDKWPIVVDSEDKIIWIPNVKKSKYNRLRTEKCDIIFKCY